MIVLKFGGSSVKNAAYIDKCLSIMRGKDAALAVVFSASGDSTDILERIAELVRKGDAEKVEKALADIRSHHCNILSEFGIPETCITSLLDELSSFVHGMTLLRECTARSRDTLLAFGELLSTKIIAERARQHAYPVHLADSRKCFITNNNFGKAIPEIQATHAVIKKLVSQTEVPVIFQGFIGSNKNGVTTTLGRGGSDYTASIVGSALAAEHIEIWTDVPGIMTSDPRIIPEARTVEEMSYDEAAELAYFGAKVIHPSTIQPAIEHNIPVHIKETNNPTHAGTRIHSISTSDGVKAIAMRGNIHLIQLRSSRMLNAYGFLMKMFSIFAAAQTSVDLVTTSEVSVTVSTEEKPSKALMKELSLLGKVVVEAHMGLVCLVGRRVWQNPQIIAKVFSALSSRTPIRMISLGSSDTNLSLAVRHHDIKQISTRLHATFFSSP